MRGKKWFCLVIIILEIVCITKASKCNRIPEGTEVSKSPADGRFRIRIFGNPEYYSPGEAYTIILTGIRSMQVLHKFSGFMLAVEKDPNNIKNSSGAVGHFQLMGDALTKFSDKCTNVVTETSTDPKSDIQVLWTAPSAVSGCIIFLATVIEHRDVWYMDDEPLNKRFCENEQDDLEIEQTDVKLCCACDEAKYELIFEGLWSRNTHPKDFPSNRMTRFSDIIGASHTAEYNVWEYGQHASEGLRQIAEHGSTKILESELKSQSENIRTIIKAKGMAYPNITGKTFAVFRVDSNHHLVSLVSMIDPSPDWIVGVSKFDLCLSNCSWIEQKVLNLFPADAGTDSGVTYISPDQPTDPPDVIKRIKSTSINDPRSPFYDPTRVEMKPLARVYFSRQRLYEKSCENQLSENERIAAFVACQTGNWSQWSPCSTPCGPGERRQQRSYLNITLAMQSNCTKKLTQREECVGRESYCSEIIRSEDDMNLSPECRLTDWSEWSDCSNLCGKGHFTRTRRYVLQGAYKKCQRGTAYPPKLEQTTECIGIVCGRDVQGGQTYIIPRSYRREILPRDCKLSEWSKFSLCNTTCGLGVKMRYRYPIKRNLNPDTVQRRAVDLFNRVNNVIDEDENVPIDYCPVLFCFPLNDPCYGVKLWETVICGDNRSSCAEVPSFCNDTPLLGHCRTTSNRWFYDPEQKDCAVFVYSGCGGNDNNFITRNECIKTCKAESTAPRNYQLNKNIKIDCKLSHWERGPCNVTCGQGFRIKTRKIVTHPKFGGNACPKRLTRYEKCTISCNNQEISGTTISVVGSTIEKEIIAECEYSPWSPWTPCSKTCGENSIQQRTRYVLNQSKVSNCHHRLEARECSIVPCA